jgi:TAT-translocated FGD2 family F420-dependent dehydrogenase
MENVAMAPDLALPNRNGSFNRRRLLKWASVAAAAANVGAGTVHAQPASPAASRAEGRGPTAVPVLRKGMVGFMLAHEQFAIPELVGIGTSAARAGFPLLATSDHLQPWQANEGHCGEAWVTLGALGERAAGAWMGTTVTCPTLRYNPAVVAETFASLSLLYPGRVFLGVGSGEALNEQAATGEWPPWQERWDRLVEALGIIRELWSGRPVRHEGRYYSVDARLYDPPPQPIPLLTAANGRKSMRLAGLNGDGLITDPLTWKKFRSEWEGGARDAGKNPAEMPVLVEQFVVVGDENDARQAAQFWRFLPKSFKKYFNIRDPAVIQQQAEAEIPFEKLVGEWPVSTDPAVHVKAITDLFDGGATIVNVHSGQPDQKRVIEFYGSEVLPRLRQSG